MMVSRLFSLFALVCCTHHLTAQVTDTTRAIHKKRFRTLIVASGTGYSASLVGLHSLWYKNSEKQSFQFFNDNAEWKQMDKLGHFYSAFQLSYAASRGLQWSGVNKKPADFWGSATGFLVLLPIEIFDGFSADYGASVGDLMANTLGAGFYLGQSRAWNEVRIYPKLSFQRTPYPTLRENAILGNGLLSELIKDYNGQTFWLSFDLDKFSNFPKWLNVAIGYGADGMVYARDAPNAAAGYTAFRQYYVGIDFDLTSIKTSSRLLNTLLFMVNMIRLPAPALEFSKEGTTFRFFQF
jgi:hypothetical protein